MTAYTIWPASPVLGDTMTTSTGIIYTYNSQGAWQVVSAGSSSFSVTFPAKSPDAVIEDIKTSGTFGGASVATAWTTRVLNTNTRDPDGFVTLSSNTISVSVDMWAEWSTPAYLSNAHQSRLFNVTDNAVAAYGSSEFATGSQNVQTRSTGGALLTAGKVYRIEHYVAVANANGFGSAMAQGGEVYTRVNLWKATGTSIGSGSSGTVVGLGDSTQSWQDVTASRAVNTTYTNSTGKPIMVSFNALNSIAGSTYNLVVNGTISAAASVNAIAGGRGGVSGVVPAGNTYTVAISSGVLSSLNWNELR